MDDCCTTCAGYLTAEHLQNSRARHIGLTELTKHAILSYPLPDQPAGEKIAAFTYRHNDAENPICGTALNGASPGMLYISGTRARSLMNAPKLYDARMSAPRHQVVLNEIPLFSTPYISRIASQIVCVIEPRRGIRNGDRSKRVISIN